VPPATDCCVGIDNRKTVRPRSMKGRGKTAMSIIEILKHLYAADIKITPDGAEDTLAFLYEALSILDRKAAALMTFDGILVAAAAFALENVSATMRGHKLLKSETSKWKFLRGGMIAVILFSLAAAALCLWIARIGYPFLAGVEMANGVLDFSKEFASLEAVLLERTWYYQRAWDLSIAAVGISAVVAFVILFITPLPESSAKHGLKKRRSAPKP